MSTTLLPHAPAGAARSASPSSPVDGGALPVGNIYLGLDVHKDSVTIAVLPAGSAAPSAITRLPNDERKLQRYFARLAAGGATLAACYEASGAGYVLQRAMTRWGYACTLVAPSLIPTRPGQQRKHDRADATALARLFRAGELVAIRVPSEAEERVRDLVRCRETFQRDALRARHHVLKFLARRGHLYRAGTHWTRRHWAWLRTLERDGALAEADRVVLGEYLAMLEYTLGRRDALDRRIEAVALTPAYQTAVARLRCFRGIDTHSAMVLQSELGDWARFDSPRELMAYLGLVPRESSSGPTQRRGAITKAGNSRCRHVLIQAAWAARRRPGTGATLRARQADQPPHVIAHALKAQHRLHARYQRLVQTKGPAIAVVAVARELAGFLWAVMRELEQERAVTRTRSAQMRPSM